MTMIIDPFKIKKYRIEINKIEITPYRVDISLLKYKKVDQVVDDSLWFSQTQNIRKLLAFIMMSCLLLFRLW